MFNLNLQSWFKYAIVAFFIVAGLQSQAHAQPFCDYDETNMHQFFKLDVRPIASGPGECCFEVYLVNTADCEIWYEGGTVHSILAGQEDGIVEHTQKSKTSEIQAILGPNGEIKVPGIICVDANDFPALREVTIKLKKPAIHPPVIYQVTYEILITDCEGNSGCCPKMAYELIPFETNDPNCCGYNLKITPSNPFSLCLPVDILHFTEAQVENFFPSVAPGSPPPSILYPVVICDGEKTIEYELLSISPFTSERIVLCKRKVRITCEGVVEEVYGDGEEEGGIIQKASTSIPSLAGSLSIAPNPVVDIANINYTLLAETPVHLELYNAQGQRIQILSEGVRGKGEHTLQYDTKHLASGMYFVHLKLGDQVVTVPLTIVR